MVTPEELTTDLIGLASQADALADQIRPVLAAIAAKQAELNSALGHSANTAIAGRIGSASYAHA